MSHGVSVTARPAGLRGHRVDRLGAGGGDGGPDAPPLRRPVPPRGRPHRVRPAALGPVPAPRLRDRPDVDERLDHRGPGRARPRPSGHPPGALRAVRRGRLGGRRRPRAQGRGRPAGLRLRRHRAHARRRERAGRGHLPPPVPRRARPREGGGSVLRGARRRGGPRGQAQADRRAVHPGLRGGRARPRGRVQRRRRAAVPGPGHAVPRRHRVGQRARRQHQEPPQRRRPARGPRLRPRRAAARPVQRRGARRRRGARATRGDRVAPAVPRPGARGAHRGRGHPRARRGAARGRRRRRRRAAARRAARASCGRASRCCRR